METKGIDLTKCNNLRYKAKVDGNDDYGRICVENVDTGLAFLQSDREDGYIATWHCDEPGIYGCCGRKVTDFEIIPRDPDTYRDWQVGDKVRRETNDFYEVIFRSGELVVTKTADETASSNYTCDELFGCGYRLVLTDIERQIIEEKKRYEPQDGDICFVKSDSGNCFVFIKRDGDGEYGLYNYASIDTNSSYLYPAKVKYVCRKEDIRELRPTTDEEKQLLFNAMAKEGKRWNAEKKVVEDIPKLHEFRKGEPVLVRDNSNIIWKLMAFAEVIDDLHYPYRVENGRLRGKHRFCIPYNERTMHLLGTTEDYKEGE